MRRIAVTSLVLLGITVALATWVSAAQLQSDDFQSGTVENWLGNLGDPPSLVANGGPNGAGDAFLMISADSPFGPGSHLATYNDNSNWTGDYASLDATSIRVDLMNPLDSSPLAMRIVLFGPQFTTQRWTSTDAVSVPNDGVWHSVEFSLAEADLTRVQGTSTYNSLMSSVQRIMLRHDAGPPSAGGSVVNASLGIDNIELFAPPVGIPGNFDDDDDSDGHDFIVWQRGGSPNPRSEADLQAWQQNTGTFAPAAQAANVPEPTAMGLALLAAFGQLLSRRVL